MMKTSLAVLAAALLPALAMPALAQDAPTATPIKHVIVVIGENVSFDALYGVYQPTGGEHIRNLLSQKFINADGTPGPDYAKVVQNVGTLTSDKYTPHAVGTTPYAQLPQPLTTGILLPNFTFAPANPDPRFASLTANGPYQVTSFVPYSTAATGDPVHRFFQMYQQTGGSNISRHSWAWVAVSAGTGGDSGNTPANPGQGGELMGFYNMSTGDAPYFKALADNFAISDNYHQAVMGGTGANFFAFATAGRLPVYNNAGVTVPPANQIEDPDRQSGTDDFYVRDGYSGGSWVKCADQTQPGVGKITALVLKPFHIDPKCAADTYYLVNNYNQPYDMNGVAQPLGATKYNYPPQTVPTIGEALTAGGVSWKWYTGGRDLNDRLNDPVYPLVHAAIAAAFGLPASTTNPTVQAVALNQMIAVTYNSLGDPLNASANVQGNAALKANLVGLDTFYNDVSGGTLPAVSFVVPKNLDSGHPGYSVPGKYELFLKDLITKVQASGEWASTAIVITTDEGGGNFDTGRIQPLDFFGDGPRIPLVVVSPYAKKGYVDHTYNDHVSVLKFIEHNWNVAPLASDTRDALPAPVQAKGAYVPSNGPAIGDMMSLFDFGSTTP